MGGPVAVKSDEGGKTTTAGAEAPAKAIAAHTAHTAHADYAPDSLSSRIELEEEDRRPAGPFVKVALCWVAGVALGAMVGGLLAWFAIAVGATGAATWFALKRRLPGVRCWGAVALLACGACWFIVRIDYVPPDHVSHYTTEDAQLAHVIGVIDSDVNVTPPQRGSFARFSYEAPQTTFEIDLEAIEIDGEMHSLSGRIIGKIRQAETRLEPGMRVDATGWLQAIDGPYNPGELDYRDLLRRQDLDGRITMSVRGNCKPIADAETGQVEGGPSLRQRASTAAADSLRLGMQHERERVAFLDAILLGRRDYSLGELSDSFRKVGLAHLLAISGAHLAMLMLLVWAIVRLLVPHPGRASLIVLAVLALYLMSVPLKVPIVRAGIMAALLMLGGVIGRRVRGIDMIAVSAVIVLLWRPGDLLTAGFQLSFGIVAGLLLFARPVSQWFFPDRTVVGPADHVRMAITRRFFDLVAVNVVSFLIALPLVAYHFQLISPLAVVLSLFALPVVIALLGLGYLKIIIGLVLPSAGMVLAGPVEWMADTMTNLVEHAASWPASSVTIARQPSIGWLIATMALTVALLSGCFARRRWALGAGAMVCTVWLMLPQHPMADAIAEQMRGEERPAARLNMFAVGDGSCFLIRIEGSDDEAAATGGGHTLMFDCGSQGYLDLGGRSIGPALREMGVRHIDTLMLSHADIDHFGGVLDLLDHVTIGRVLAPPQLIAEAAAHPATSTGFLVTQLETEHRLIVQPVSRGWRETWGRANASDDVDAPAGGEHALSDDNVIEAELLWPPADYETDRANDMSLVLSVRVAGRRILLNGDIEREAIPALLATGVNLRADVTDLPHHGSFVGPSPRWLDAVQPRVVLQSSGKARLRRDKWADTLKGRDIERFISALDGMVEVRIARDGELSWTTFRKRE